MILRLRYGRVFAIMALFVCLTLSVGSVSILGQTEPKPSPTPLSNSSLKPTATPTITPPAEIQCNESPENAKQCIDTIVTQLRSIKTSSEDYVGILKAERKETSALKTSYAQLKTKTKAVITLLTRSNPQFNQLKVALNAALTAHNSFSNDANIALTGNPPTGSFPINFFANLLLDNICRVLPNQVSGDVCKSVVDYIRTLQLKRTTSLRKWDKIPPLG